jgi:hypothetical protein
MTVRRAPKTLPESVVVPVLVPIPVSSLLGPFNRRPAARKRSSVFVSCDDDPKSRIVSVEDCPVPNVPSDSPGLVLIRDAPFSIGRIKKHADTRLQS